MPPPPKKNHHSPGQADGTKNGHQVLPDPCQAWPLLQPTLSLDAELLQIIPSLNPCPLSSAALCLDALTSYFSQKRGASRQDFLPSVLWSRRLSTNPQERTLFPSWKMCSPPLHPSPSWVLIVLLHPSFLNAPLIAPLLALILRHTQVSSTLK